MSQQGYYAGIPLVASPPVAEFLKYPGKKRPQWPVFAHQPINFQLFPGPLAAIANSQVILCFSSQTHLGRGRSLGHMSAKYFTQFRLTDADYRGGNEFSGVVELSRPMDNDSDVTDIEAVLAKNFDLRRSSVQLVSWSRLH
jgi:hypothetical protein